MCNHQPECNDLQSHINKLWRDKDAAPKHAEYFGEPIKADFAFVIRFESEKLEKINNFRRACADGDFDSIKAFIEAQGGVNRLVGDNNRDSILKAAVDARNFVAINFMLDLGGDPDLKIEGESVREYMEKKGDSEMLDYFNARQEASVLSGVMHSDAQSERMVF